jgi:hypothetical protein
MLLGYRFDGRRKRSAQPAPGSPEVNQHRHFRLQNNFLKIFVVYFLDVLTHSYLPRVISSTMALFMHPSATSSAPR